MQAQFQAPVAAVPPGWPTIVPGPFILLFLLPAIPLLLFSIGARPPDTSALPFSTDDIFTTTAFITAAGAVVLALGVYPDSVKGVLGWVAEGDWVGDGWVGWEWLGVNGGVGGGGGGSGGMQQVQYDARGVRVQRESYVDHRRSASRVHAQLQLAAQNTSALRQAFSRWYSPSPPNLAILTLLIFILAIALLLLVGQALSPVYASEEVLERGEDKQREYANKKKSETPEERAERKEREALEEYDKKQAEKKKKKEGKDGKEADGGEGDGDDDGGAEGKAKAEDGEKTKSKPLRSADSERLRKMGVGNILRTAFLGPSRPRSRPSAAAHSAVVIDTPGVEAAPDQVAMAAREHSTATAEAMARQVEAGRG